MSESLSKEEFERKEQMVKLNQEALRGNMNSTDYEQTYTDLKWTDLQKTNSPLFMRAM